MEGCLWGLEDSATAHCQLLLFRVGFLFAPWIVQRTAGGVPGLLSRRGGLLLSRQRDALVADWEASSDPEQRACLTRKAESLSSTYSGLCEKWDRAFKVCRSTCDLGVEVLRNPASHQLGMLYMHASVLHIKYACSGEAF